jgi:Icc protein
MLMGLDVNARLAQVLTHATGLAPDAFFLTGDFCASEPIQEIFHQLRARLDLLGVEYFITPGNHDDRKMLRNAFYLEGHNYEPIRGLVRVKNHDFLFLDSSTGKVNDDQVEWLTNALKTHPEAAIVMHHPPVPMGVVFMDKKYPLRETGHLLSALTADGQPRRVFCGHYHSGRTVHWKNLEVHICPPTSFYIKPNNEDFQQDFLPPGYLMLEWPDEGGFRVVPQYVTG